MKKDMTVDFLITQGMLIHGSNTPYEYLKKVQLEKTGDVSHLVTQDVLLLAGTEDFGVPLDHFYKQIEALKGAGPAFQFVPVRTAAPGRADHLGHDCLDGSAGRVDSAAGHPGRPRRWPEDDPVLTQ
jgi:hypothetical protein